MVVGHQPLIALGVPDHLECNNAFI